MRHTDVRRTGGTEATNIGFAAGEGVKYRGLAAGWQTENADLHKLLLLVLLNVSKVGRVLCSQAPTVNRTARAQNMVNTRLFF